MEGQGTPDRLIAVRQLYNFALLHHTLSDPAAWRRAVDRLSHPEMRRVVGGHAALQRYLFGLDLAVPEPTVASQLHLARCVASYAIPYLADIETNLVLAFAANTMTERYPGSSPNAARVRHLKGLFHGGMETVRRRRSRPGTTDGETKNPEMGTANSDGSDTYWGDAMS